MVLSRPVVTPKLKYLGIEVANSNNPIKQVIGCGHSHVMGEAFIWFISLNRLTPRVSGVLPDQLSC